MVRCVLEDGGEMYLSDLDGACAPARVMVTKCLESGFMIGGEDAQRSVEALVQIVGDEASVNFLT